MKGCVQLGLVPDINNTVNMVPVDSVAHYTALSALTLPLEPLQATVLHVTARPPIRFNDILGALSTYGYAVSTTGYLVWRRKLEQHVIEVQDNALFPLLHFVLDDLPTSTKAPELSDSNTQALLRRNGERAGRPVDDELMGKYLSWLVDAGFLDPPAADAGGKALPKLDNAVSAKAVGRTGR